LKRRSRILIAGLAVSASTISCDEGRLVTDVERGPFPVVIDAPDGPDTLYVGETRAYETHVTLDGVAITSPVVRWSSTPPGLLVFDTTTHDASLSVLARSPGLATLTTRVDDPDLVAQQSSRPVHVLLLGVSAVRPASGDTTLTALGDAVTVRAKGIGVNGIASDSAGLQWTHRGSALSVAAQPAGLDTLRVTAVAPGTDTLIFAQEDGRCTVGQCTDTILVRVTQAPAQIVAPDTVRLFTLGRSVTPTVSVLDANETPIVGATVTWSLGTETDSERVEVSPEGTLTARGNGSVPVIVRAGDAEDTVTAVVRQVVRSVAVSGTTTLEAIEATGTLVAEAADSGGSTLTRPYEVSWSARDGALVSIEEGEDGAATLRTEAVGSTWVVAEAESARDSIQVTVTQTVASITVTPDTLNALGDTLTLAAEALDANDHPIPGAEFTWSVDTPDILALLPDSTRVRSLNPGEAQVTASSGGVEGAGIVLSRQVPGAVAITPAPAPDTLLPGNTLQLSAAVSDSNGVSMPGAGVAWASEAVGVATVSGSGQVTGQPVATPDSTRVIATSGPAADTLWIFVEPTLLTSVEVTPDSVRLTALGATATLTGQPLNQAGDPMAGETVTWSSLDPDVATVSASGTVTAVGNGTTGVVATSSSDPSVADTAVVVVEQVVATVTVVPDTLNALGDTLTLAAEALDANGHVIPGTGFTWSVDTPAILELLDGGTQVISLTPGEGQVTATSDGVEGAGIVLSRQVPGAVAIAPAPAPDTLLAGNTLQLSAAVSDSNGVSIPEAGVAWASEAVDVATVTGDGEVTGQLVTTPDSARVIATSGPAADTLWIFVDPAVLTSVAVTPDSVRLTALGATTPLTAQPLNQAGDPIPGETVTWSSLDEGVATVNASGTVTAVANGTTSVVATSDSDPLVTDTAVVVVDQVVASIAVTPASHTFTSLTETHQFEATVTDSLGSPMSAPITWADDPASPGIISVSGTGIATANLVGTSGVIATTTSGIADSADVTVEQVAASITTTPALDTVAVGATTTLTATVLDSLGNLIPGHPVTWSSLNPGLATVNASTGVVTGVAVTDSVGIRALAAAPTSVADTTHIVVSSYVLEFDGGDHAAASAAVPLGSAWTVEVWVKPDNQAGTQYLLARGGVQTGNTAAYGLYLDAGRPVVFIRNGAGGGPGKLGLLVSTTTLPTAQWSHVAASFDGAMLRLYINGAPTDNIAYANNPQTSGDLTFGAADAAGASGFIGRLDEVRFWSVARTDAEISATHASRLTEVDPDLMAWWPLSEGTGNPVDRIGNIIMTFPAPGTAPVWVAEDAAANIPSP